MRGSRQCNLNSVDIYCQGALIQRPPLLHRLTQHQRAAGSEERHPPFTVLLADLPPDCFCDCKRTHTHAPQPPTHRSQAQKMPGGMSSIQVMSFGHRDTFRLHCRGCASFVIRCHNRDDPVFTWRSIYGKKHRPSLLSVISISGQTMTVI